MSPEMPTSRSTEELVEAAEERLVETRDLAERIAAVRGWAESSGGEIRVTVDGRGALVDLRLADSVRQSHPDEIARAITELATVATQMANRQSVNELGRTMGDRIVDMLPQMGIPDLMSSAPPPVTDFSAVAEDPPTGPLPLPAPPEDDDLQHFDFSRFRSDR